MNNKCEKMVLCLWRVKCGSLSKSKLLVFRYEPCEANLHVDTCNCSASANGMQIRISS